MRMRVIQLKMMAVGTVGCGVVDLCGSNAFSVLESTILIGCVVLFVVACKNRIIEHHNYVKFARVVELIK